jgi:chemotaxis protein MotB
MGAMLTARAVSVVTLGLAFAACAGPKAEAPPPAPAPKDDKLTQIDTDVKRIREIAVLDRENEEKKIKVNQLEKKVVELQAQLEEALGKGAGQPTVGRDTPGGHKVKVEMPGELLFSAGSARISRDGRRVLDQIVGVLKNAPSHRIEVAGHTDSTPIGKKYEDNWQLSAERARRVVAYLFDKGVTGKQMVAAGYADTQPLDPANSPEARAKNRRVELFIEPNQD